MRGGPSQLVLGKSSSGLYPQVLVSQTAMSPGSHYACGDLIAFAYFKYYSHEPGHKGLVSAVIPQKGVFTINIVDNPVNYSASTPIRVEPVQARSAARVGALLDAACHTMHEVGYEQLTTAMVAERAGASIGTVYRYFPDRVAVLQAVAGRNLERATRALRADLERDNPSSVSGALATALETLIRFFREEQGFRSLRTGDVLDIRPLTGSRGGNAEIAAVIRDYLHEVHNVRLDSPARVAIETAVDVTDALLGRAFMHSDRGDSTVLSEARRVAESIVQDL